MIVIYVTFFTFIYFLCFLYLLYYLNSNSKIILKDKDNQIRNLKIKLTKDYKLNDKHQTIKMKEPTITHSENISTIDKAFLNDQNFYNNHIMKLYDNINKIGYAIIINSHSIEKGLSHFKLRVFGDKKIDTIIDLLKKDLIYKNYEKDFSFINGINILRNYAKIYKENNWTKEIEYKKSSEFIQNFINIKILKVGAFILKKEELINDYKVDYKNFVKSRHSIRNYKKMKLKQQDIRKAIDIAKYTPSACNRQNIKVHFYSNKKMKQDIINNIKWKNRVNLKSLNIFIITFDVNGLNGTGGRNQGYFNAGLFSMNLVNSLHSLGIGSYFIQYGNNYEEEEKLKKFNKIPLSERIAIIIFSGYYKNKSMVTISQRKKLSDYLIVHNE